MDGNGKTTSQRGFIEIDPLAEDYYGIMPYVYGLNNPIRFVDPDGMQVDDIYVDTDGNYLGRDGSDDNTVRVVENSTWESVGGAAGAQTAEGTATLQNAANSTPLVGTSKEQPGYQKGIGISDATWGEIEAAGGERATPFLSNDSDDTVFVKPESKVDSGPGATADNAANPVGAGQSVYGLVDGVTTSKYSDAVYKVSNFNRIRVTNGGNVSLTGLGGIGSALGQLSQGGFRDMSKFGNWNPLMNKAKSIGNRSIDPRSKLAKSRPFELK